MASFTPEVVQAVMQHMNSDHPSDCLTICRALGHQPDATAAAMIGMDNDGIDFEVFVGGATLPVRVPFSEHLTDRAQVRVEVVRMHDAAVAALADEG